MLNLKNDSSHYDANGILFRMKLKKILICFSVVIGLCGCRQQPEEMYQLKDGTYQAKAQGYGGDIVMEAEVSAGVLKSLCVNDHHETDALADYALYEMPDLMVEYQSVNIDVSTGATVTSKAVIACAKDIVEQAGGKLSDWDKKIAVKSNEKTIEENSEVVVIGGGAAGISAALRLNQHDISTMIVEKAAFLGGALQYDFTQTQLYTEKENNNLNVSLLQRHLFDTIVWQKNDLGIRFEEENSVSVYQSTTATLLSKEVQASNVDVLLETCVYDIAQDDEGVMKVYGKSSDGTMYVISCEQVIVATGSSCGKETVVGGVRTNTDDLGGKFVHAKTGETVLSKYCLTVSEGDVIEVSDAVKVAGKAGLYEFSDGESDYLLITQRAYRKWKETVLEKMYLSDEEKKIIKNDACADIHYGKTVDELRGLLQMEIPYEEGFENQPCYIVRLVQAPIETTGGYQVDELLRVYQSDSEVYDNIYGIGSCVDVKDVRMEDGSLNAWAFVSGKFVADELAYKKESDVSLSFGK